MSQKKKIFDEVKFSKCIRKHSCIWYSKHEDYKNAQARKEAWKEIAKEMNKPKEDLSKRNTRYRDGCLKRFKSGHLSHGDIWYFFKKDFVHKKKANRNLYTKKCHTTASADKETVENEKIPPVRIRVLRSYKFLGRTCGDSVTTESDESETNFDADGPENVKRRKRDVDHENQRNASCHMPKTTDGSEEIQYVDNNEKYDDRLNCSETNLEKSMKKISTENRDEERPADKCPSLLETAALGDSIIDDLDEEIRMDKELPSTSLSEHNTSVNPQQTNKEKYSDTKTNVKQSRTTKYITTHLISREAKVEDNNNRNTSRITDLTNEDLNNSEYEEDDEVNDRKGGNSVWESDQLWNGNENSKKYFKNDCEVLIREENGLDHNRSGEEENIGDHVNHAEDEFEGLEDNEDGVEHMTTMMKQQSVLLQESKTAGRAESCGRQGGQAEGRVTPVATDDSTASSSSSGVKTSTHANKRVRHEGDRTRSAETATVPPTEPAACASVTVSSAATNGLSAAQGLSSINIAIQLENFPEETLSKDDVLELQRRIVDEILKAEDPTRLQFRESYHKGGALVLICENEDCRVWLMQTVPKLSVGGGRRLVFVDYKDHLQSTRVVLTPPDHLAERDVKKIMELVGTQNRDIKIDEWRVVNDNEEKGYRTITLLIDEHSATSLKNMHWKISLGLGKVKLEDISKRKAAKASVDEGSRPSV